MSQACSGIAPSADLASSGKLAQCNAMWSGQRCVPAIGIACKHLLFNWLTSTRFAAKCVVACRLRWPLLVKSGVQEKHCMC